MGWWQRALPIFPWTPLLDDDENDDDDWAFGPTAQTWCAPAPGNVEHAAVRHVKLRSAAAERQAAEVAAWELEAAALLAER